MAGQLYGSGLRLMKGLWLQVKNLDFTRRELTVWDCKCGKDRLTLLPQSLVAALQRHLGVGLAVGVSPAETLA